MSTRTAGDLTETNISAALDHATQEIGRTDTKAGVLLGLHSVLVAALALLGHQIPAAALAFAIVASIALIVAVMLALLVVRPRLGAPNGVADRSSFVYWAKASPEEIAAGMAEDRRALRISALSAIALRKMRLLRQCTHTTAAAVVALALAAIITAA